MVAGRRAFTIQEAERLKGRRVKLTAPLVHRFEGETGEIVGSMEYGDGYAVLVHWDIRFGSGQIRADYFTADECPAVFREV